MSLKKINFNVFGLTNNTSLKPRGPSLRQKESRIRVKGEERARRDGLLDAGIDRESKTELEGDDTGLKDLRILGNASLYQVFKLFKPAAAGQ